jgi:hypothetical protein
MIEDKGANRLVTSYWFIAGLFILICNDLFLKAYLHNFITGKLSDISGLFIFPLFWSYWCPKWKKLIYIVTAVLFILWKSPYSQPLIDLWNINAPYSISRVLDPTDLFALLILPVSSGIASNESSLKGLRISPLYPIVVASFAFLATSKADIDVAIDKTYVLAIPEDSLMIKLVHLDCSEFARKEWIPSSADFDFKICIRKGSYEEYYLKMHIDPITDSITKLTIIQAVNASGYSDEEEVRKVVTDEFEGTVIPELTRSAYDLRR